MRSTIKIEVTSAPAGPRYDAEEYPMQAVGESYNQAAIRSIAEAHPERGQLEDSAVCEVGATLIPETDNQHDANAVRVEIDALTVLRQASQPLGPMGAEWLKWQGRALEGER